jgi:hypothetical protein
MLSCSYRDAGESREKQKQSFNGGELSQGGAFWLKRGIAEGGLGRGER